MAKKGKSKGKGGKSKSKGLFGAIGSALGSIPVVGKVKNAAKSVKKKVKKAKNKVKKKIKKAKKKLKKKIGKVYTKARKIKNNLSKSKIVKKFKQVAKKAVLSTKQAVKKTTVAVKETTKKVIQEVKNTVKQAVAVLKPTKKPEKMKNSSPPRDKSIGKKIEGEAELQAFFDEYLKNPRSTDDKITYEDMRKVLGGNGSGTIDGFAPFGVVGYELFVKDFVTMANPNSTPEERAAAQLSAITPAKFAKGGKALNNLKDLEKGLESAYDLANDPKKSKGNQKDIDQLGEYVKSLDKGTDEINYFYFNKTHKDSLPKPKGDGPNGGKLQSHHGLQQEWAKNNLSQYGYDSKLAPTITIETGKGLPHTIISNAQTARRNERMASGVGKWSTTLQEELQFMVDDLTKAGFSRNTTSQVLEQQYKMLDKLGVKYERIDY